MNPKLYIMTKNKVRVLFVLVILAILCGMHTSVYSQIEVESRGVEVECIDDSKTQFYIDGEFYKSSNKKDVYVCPLKESILKSVSDL